MLKSAERMALGRRKMPSARSLDPINYHSSTEIWFQHMLKCFKFALGCLGMLENYITPTARFLEIPMDLSGRFSTGPLESRSRSPTLCGDPDIEPLSEILGVLRTGDPHLMQMVSIRSHGRPWMIGGTPLT